MKFFLSGIACVFLISFGQILFKLAAGQLSSENVVRFFVSMITNYYLLSAFIIYLCASILWILFLRSVALNIAYPIMALAFIIVPVLARIFLSEEIGVNNILGGALIVLGIAIISH